MTWVLSQKINGIPQEDEISAETKSQVIKWIRKMTPFPNKAIMELNRQGFCDFDLANTNIELTLEKLNETKDHRVL